ncbi:MAG: FHA domain-containing protein [Actinomycetota bacterium]
MTLIDRPPHLEALYSPLTGRRLAPDDGRAPIAGTPVAVLVVDGGPTIPLFGDAVLGRRPFDDRRVVGGVAESIVLDDPRRCVSRCHAFLRVDRWRVEAIDLGSCNGTSTSVDGGPWSSLVPGIGHVLRDGQRLRLGRIGIAVHLIGR